MTSQREFLNVTAVNVLVWSPGAICRVARGYRMCHALARGLFTFPRPLIFSHGPNLFVYILGRPCERFISTLPNNVILLFRGFPYEFCGFLMGSLGQVHRCECYYSVCKECATPLLGVCLLSHDP